MKTENNYLSWKSGDVLINKSGLSVIFKSFTTSDSRFRCMDDMMWPISEFRLKNAPLLKSLDIDFRSSYYGLSDNLDARGIKYNSLTSNTLQK